MFIRNVRTSKQESLENAAVIRITKIPGPPMLPTEMVMETMDITPITIFQALIILMVH